MAVLSKVVLAAVICTLAAGGRVGDSPPDREAVWEQPTRPESHQTQKDAAEQTDATQTKDKRTQTIAEQLMASFTSMIGNGGEQRVEGDTATASGDEHWEYEGGTATEGGTVGEDEGDDEGEEEEEEEEGEESPRMPDVSGATTGLAAATEHELESQGGSGVVDLGPQAQGQGGIEYRGPVPGTGFEPPPPPRGVPSEPIPVTQPELGSEDEAERRKGFEQPPPRPVVQTEGERGNGAVYLGPVSGPEPQAQGQGGIEYRGPAPGSGYEPPPPRPIVQTDGERGSGVVYLGPVPVSGPEPQAHRQGGIGYGGPVPGYEPPPPPRGVPSKPIPVTQPGLGSEDEEDVAERRKGFEQPPPRPIVQTEGERGSGVVYLGPVSEPELQARGQGGIEYGGPVPGSGFEHPPPPRPVVQTEGERGSSVVYLGPVARPPPEERYEGAQFAASWAEGTPSAGASMEGEDLGASFAEPFETPPQYVSDRQREPYGYSQDTLRTRQEPMPFRQPTHGIEEEVHHDTLENILARRGWTAFQPRPHPEPQIPTLEDSGRVFGDQRGTGFKEPPPQPQQPPLSPLPQVSGGWIHVSSKEPRTEPEPVTDAEDTESTDLRHEESIDFSAQRQTEYVQPRFKPPVHIEAEDEKPQYPPPIRVQSADEGPHWNLPKFERVSYPQWPAPPMHDERLARILREVYLNLGHAQREESLRRMYLTDVLKLVNALHDVSTRFQEIQTEYPKSVKVLARTRNTLTAQVMAVDVDSEDETPQGIAV